MCKQGFAGPVCNESIEEICELGYTGPDCTIIIDECAGINCSGNGQCEIDLRTERGFKCNCSSSYTGEFCESLINMAYELRVTINAYSNPTNTCAECNRCCDTICSNGCDTFFTLCTRPYMTPPPLTLPSPGTNCPLNSIMTRVDENSNGAVFGETVLGIQNPVIFTNLPDVSHIIILLGMGYNNFIEVVMFCELIKHAIKHVHPWHAPL